MTLRRDPSLQHRLIFLSFLHRYRRCSTSIGWSTTSLLDPVLCTNMNPSLQILTFVGSLMAVDSNQ